MNNTTATRKYIFFGEYPQTLKTDDVEITGFVDDYWMGSDGERYVLKVANLQLDIGLPKPYFGDGREVVNNQEYFFKVEALRWMVLTESDEAALLLSDKVIDGMQFCTFPHHSEEEFYDDPQTESKYGDKVLTYKNGCVVVERRIPHHENIFISYERYYHRDGVDSIIYDNNYKFSDIRKWLNTHFYNITFNKSEKQKILTVEIDNSAKMSEPFETESWAEIQAASFSQHIGRPFNTDNKEAFSCKNTKDKVFLASVRELTNDDYGFPQAYGGHGDPVGVLSKKVSDYAIACGSWVYDGSPINSCGWWWLRSPNLSRDDIVHMVRFDGRIYSDEFYPSDEYGGIVPAIKIAKR